MVPFGTLRRNRSLGTGLKQLNCANLGLQKNAPDKDLFPRRNSWPTIKTLAGIPRVAVPRSQMASIAALPAKAAAVRLKSIATADILSAAETSNFF